MCVCGVCVHACCVCVHVFMCMCVGMEVWVHVHRRQLEQCNTNFMHFPYANPSHCHTHHPFEPSAPPTTTPTSLTTQPHLEAYYCISSQTLSLLSNLPTGAPKIVWRTWRRMYAAMETSIASHPNPQSSSTQPRRSSDWCQQTWRE